MDTDPEMTDEQLDAWAEQLRESRRIQEEWTERTYARILEQTTLKPTIYMLKRPTTDDHGVVTIGAWGGYLIQLMPMAYSDRLVMTPQDEPGVYDFGWCFPKGGAAYLAALAWDPETQAEPVGYKKQVGIARRRAGAKWQVANQISERELQWLKKTLGGSPTARNLTELMMSLEVHG